MGTRRCPSCGAPLPEAGGACTYCRAVPQEPEGSTHEVVIERHIEREVTREKVTVKPAPLPPPPPPIPPPPPPRPLMTPSEVTRVKKSGANAIGCLMKLIGVVFGASFCCILVGAVFGPPPSSSSRSSSSSTTTGSETDSKSASSGAASSATVYTDPRDLRPLPDGTYPIAIAVSSLAEDWDATLALPWAMTYAKAWSKDAVLLRIEVVGADSRGRLKLGEQFNEVVYTFWPEVSPDPANEDVERSKEEASRASKGLTVAPTPRTRELAIRIGNGKAFAVISPIVSPAGGKPSDFWPKGHPQLSSLTMLRLFERIGTWRRIEAGDQFNGELNYERREGWTWTFTPRDSSGTFRVRASDGQRAPDRSSSR